MNSLRLTSRRSRQRGSVLIVTLIFAGVIAVALVSYLRLSTGALNLSMRSFLNNGAMNLVDAGLEQAVWSFNQATSGNAAAWTGWTISGNDATRSFSNFNLSQNATGVVKLYVQNYNSAGGTQPLLVAQAIITPASGPTVTKQVEVTLKRRSLFATGLVAKNGITFNGNNASVDSWNSDPDADPSTAAVVYSNATKHDAGSVGSTSVSVSAINLGNADIWGYAATAAYDPSVGSNGTIAAYGSAQGTIDHSRISHDFTANFDTPVAPTPSTVNYIASTIGNGDLPLTLPRAGDTAVGGVYYYSVPAIITNGNSTNVLTIASSRDVVLLLTAGSGSTAVSLGGNAAISISSGASLQIYAAGNIDIAGNGIVNSNTQPKNLEIWGTNTSSGGQTIKISGNGSLSAICYAPNAALEIKGGGSSGSVYGAFVANTVTLTGNDAFHYDESLAALGANNPFGITKWRELTSSEDRALYAARLNF